MSELIPITDTIGQLDVQLAYAGTDNFAGRAVYAAGAQPALRPQAAQCLARALDLAGRCGLGLRLFDSYRPAAAQALFWQVLPDARYVADPAAGSNHTRGVAVDLTLLDAQGQPLPMGTAFDAMCEQSHHDRTDLPPAQQRNRHLLLGIMLRAGFLPLPTEWWHYELPDARAYAPIPSDPLVPLRAEFVPAARAPQASPRALQFATHAGNQTHSAKNA